VGLGGDRVQGVLYGGKVKAGGWEEMGRAEGGILERGSSDSCEILKTDHDFGFWSKGGGSWVLLGRITSMSRAEPRPVNLDGADENQ